MTMPIEINALETDRFGITAARVTEEGSHPDAIDTAARDAGVDMLTVRVPVSNLARVHALEAAGFRLMDTLVYYRRDLVDLPHRVSFPEGLSCRLAQPEDAADVGKVARVGFTGYMGHYHADPRLDDDAADAAYAEWAGKSVTSVSDQAPVLLVCRETVPVGFLTLRRNSPEEFEIVLNAVHPDSRGTGVYSCLVAEALERACNAQASSLIVSTQINNYGVQRVWSRAGFYHYQSLYTLHKWYD